MKPLSERYDRNIRLFGEEGQRRLQAIRIAIVGVGGLGSALVQHLALLGVAEIAVIEPQELDESNRNRLIGARVTDPVPGIQKAIIAERTIRETNSEVAVRVLPFGLVAKESFDCIKSADWVFGGFDDDGPRHILNELCAAYAKPYIDLASDVPEDGVYGGRVCVSRSGEGCLFCLGLLDPKAVALFLSSPSDRATKAALYGIDLEHLGQKGPSVSPLNGVVASLGALEFMAAVTGLRAPNILLNFYGHLGTLTKIRNHVGNRDCPVCAGLYGTKQTADVERYLRIPHLVEVR